MKKKARRRNKEKIIELKRHSRNLKKRLLTNSILRTVQRINAVIAHYNGNSIETVAACYDICPRTLSKWINDYEFEGILALEDNPRSGRPQRLPKGIAAKLVNTIENDNQRVWVARHVYHLLSTISDVLYSVKYLPQFLRKLGLSYHKAIHTLIKKDSAKRQKWIQETLPAIYQKKIKEGWRIFYQDEAGFATEGTLTHTWGMKGKQIHIENYGRHGRVNVIGAFELVTGKFHGIVTSFKVNAQRFRRFILHLKREMKTDKILLICDNASFHKAKWLTEWAKAQSGWLNLEFLPAYSPDFNPIERVWRWMKTEYLHNHCWRTKDELKRYLAEIVAKTESQAIDLIGIMKKENERFEEIYQFYEVPMMMPFEIQLSTAA